MDLSSGTQELREAKEEAKNNPPNNPLNRTDNQTKKELFAELDKLKTQINNSRNELNKADNEKEMWFKKKKGFSDIIRNNAGIIKKNKQKRDSLTKDVKALKEERGVFNEEIRKKISEVEKLKGQIKDLTKKSGIKDPYLIKGEIDRIEVKLETEDMPFEKEKEISKKLKQFKKMLSEASEAILVMEGIKKLNLEIRSARKSSNDVHNKVQKMANESQELHESMIKSSKEIRSLEASEKESFRNFVESKKRFNSLNNSLKENLSRMNSLRNKINQFNLEEDEKKKLKDSLLIKSKEQEIEEKIKTGKKLTTEDFLVFQESIKGKK